MTLVDTTPRPLGSLVAGPLAFGCWRFTNADVGAARHLIETAVDNGLNLIDTADVYGLDWGGTGFGANEELLGKVLADAPELRQRIVLATKGGIRPPVPYDSSATYLTEAVDGSLRRLNTDTIDLYIVHRPDMYTHPAEVAEALTKLRDAGKIREVGVSNYTPDQYDALAALLDFPIAVSQPQFSAAHLEPMRDGTFDRCMRDGVIPLAWSPLAGGQLATGYGLRSGLIMTLDGIAQREGTDRTTIALAFVLAHPSRPIAILGTQNPERIVDATRALGVHLDRNDCYDIVESSEGVSLP